MWDFLNYEVVAVDYSSIGFLQVFYFGFNAFEALAWCTCAAIVFRRWRRNDIRRRKFIMPFYFSYLV